MKKLTFKAAIYRTVDVPDECPNTPGEAYRWLKEQSEENPMEDFGSDWKTDSIDEGSAEIIFIDQLNEAGEYAEVLYEE